MLPDLQKTPILSTVETYSSLFNPAVIQTFLRSIPGTSSFYAYILIRLENFTSFEAINAVTDCIGRVPASQYFVDDCGYITFNNDDGKPNLMLSVSIGDGKPFEKIKRSITINFFGLQNEIETAYSAIAEKFVTERRPDVTWYCLNNGRIDSFPVACAPPLNYTDQFYPWIKGGVDNYYDNYMLSESNILLLYGEPGTGKTSFIRNLMWRHCLSTMISYDQDMFEQDQFFISFLNSNNQLLVIEDADTMLLSREEERNQIISKILNASDGLIKIPQKKIVFTTNITNMAKIDSALLRPGRCYDIVEFRKLSMVEAQAAADSVGVTIPLRQDGYTLAELFNYMTPAGEAKKGQRLGFR